jgi:putative ABC transport system permease protein
MLKDYIKTALRIILKHKLHSLISIVGLALAIACCLLLILYIAYELSYDSFHEHAGRIFRVNSAFIRDNSQQIQAITQAPLGPVLKHEFPEVEYAARFLFPEYNVKYQDNIFTEKVTFTDPDFLRIFSFHLLMGNPDQLLKEKNTIVISDALARKYFGNSNPVGKQLTIIRFDEYFDFTVSGVIENPPDNSSIQFDILVPFEKLQDFLEEDYFSNWDLFSVCTFIQLYESAQAGLFNSKITSLIKKYHAENEIDYYLQPLPDIHFASTVQASMTPASSITYSYILGGITLLILLIASFNSMNIATALISMRYREIGVRRAIGAFRSQIIFQFYTETVIITTLAFILSLLFAELFLPIFNSLTDKTLTLGIINHWTFWGLAIVAIGILSFLSSLSPSLLLTKVQPADLYEHRQFAGNGRYFSRWLITIQFSLSIFLIICTFVMSNQLYFLKTKNLGFNDEQIVVIPFHNGQSQQMLDTYRTKLSSYTSIINISGAISYPGGNFHRTRVTCENIELSVTHIKTDYDFLNTFGITLKEGRNFSKDVATDTTQAVIINETFSDRMGWTSALGKKVVIDWMGSEAEIIGVTKDFHYQTLHEKIEPLVFYLDPFVPLYYFFVKIKPEGISQTLVLLKTQWQAVVTDHPFEFFFLNKKIDQQYHTEERWGTIVKYSSVLAVFVACFGLFGLSALLMTKRSKEIGIRKVVGASSNQIVFIFSKEFTKWIILANIIAWPSAYYLMDYWLQNFAYKIDIDLWTFPIAGVVALFIAWITISSQTIKTAFENPVKSLRYE